MSRGSPFKEVSVLLDVVDGSVPVINSFANDLDVGMPSREIEVRGSAS